VICADGEAVPFSVQATASATGAAAVRDGHLVFLGAETEPEVPTPQFAIAIGGTRADWFGSNLGRQVLLGFRPEDISFASDQPGATLLPRIEAKVKSSQFLGAEMHCHLLVGERTLVIRVAANSDLHPSQIVRLSFDFTRAHVFDAATGAAIF
jgi:multiple sugar transport system ATP-binding protein